jgi:hypothetical protein
VTSDVVATLDETAIDGEQDVNVTVKRSSAAFRDLTDHEAHVTGGDGWLTCGGDADMSVQLRHVTHHVTDLQEASAMIS